MKTDFDISKRLYERIDKKVACCGKLWVFKFTKIDFKIF